MCADCGIPKKYNATTEIFFKYKKVIPVVNNVEIPFILLQKIPFIQSRDKLEEVE